MLSSNISSVSKTSLSVHRCLAPTPATVVRSARSLPRGPRSYQQSRSFRIGYWSSYLDPNFQKEIHRRHRVVKHKYMEAITRKLSWDRHFPIAPQKGAFRASCAVRGMPVIQDLVEDGLILMEYTLFGTNRQKAGRKVLKMSRRVLLISSYLIGSRCMTT